jgi:hypothetical protein
VFSLTASGKTFVLTSAFPEPLLCPRLRSLAPATGTKWSRLVVSVRALTHALDDTSSCAIILAMSRTTPDSADLMPEVLRFLKGKNEMKKQEIATYMRTWIKENGFDDRERSIGWALNRLEKECYVAHPRIGFWRITEKGSACTLTVEESRKIMEKWTQRERGAKRAGRRPKR